VKAIRVTAGHEAPQAKRSTAARVLTNPQAAICLAFLLGVTAFGALAGVIAPKGPNFTDLAITNAPPFTPGHLLGGDGAGRDMLARLAWGTHQSAIACAMILAVSVVVGMSSGLIAGFYRGKFEAVANFVCELFMSLPGVVLLIALYSLTGPNTAAAMGAYGLLIAPSYFRIVRGIVLGVRNELYVDAAKVVGLSDFRIVGRHVLWAVRGPVVIQSAFVLASGIGIEAGVAFLGLSDPARASWGVTLQNAFDNIYANPVAVVWPALLVSATIMAFILLGNALSDVLAASSRSVRLSPRRRREVQDAARPAPSAEPAPRAAGSSGNPPAPVDSPLALSIRGLRVGYPTDAETVREVVHGADLDIHKGEVHGLVGESGSGKTQMALAALGILPREAVLLGGSVFFDGADLLQDPKLMARARGQRIGYIPQEPMTNLDPSFTVGAQLVYGLRAARPMPKREARERVADLLRQVGIGDPKRVMGLYPHEVSGGMAQRILICGAIAPGPDILVADEPTTALDVTVQAEVLDLLRGLVRDRGLATLLVTHNLGVVADMCDTVSVMKEGLIVEKGTVDQIFNQPVHEYTLELLTSSRHVELMEAV
jgi:peptide/nickel transport system permease protein